MCGAGSQVAQDVFTDHTFDYVILDEISQASELSCLIPLQYQAQKVILLGDDKQLPPVILDREAGQKGLQLSLFERMIECGVQPFMLQTQYRMSPEIRHWPSAHFYDNQLQDDASIYSRPVPDLVKKIKHPVMFLDIEDSKDKLKQPERSYFNQTEVECIVQILGQLYSPHQRRESSELSRVGIIAPYTAQVQKLKKAISKRISRNEISVNTVDAYQGHEKDIIIISCTRSNRLGFLDNKKRLNVMITRAKFGLLIVGNAHCLENDPHWKDLIESMKTRGLYCNFKAKEMPNKVGALFY